MFKETLKCIYQAEEEPVAYQLNTRLRDLLSKKNKGEIKPETLTDELLMEAACFVGYLNMVSETHRQIKLHVLSKHETTVLLWVKNLLLHIAATAPVDTSRLDELKEAMDHVRATVVHPPQHGWSNAFSECSS